MANIISDTEVIHDLGRGLTVKNRFVKYDDGTMLMENMEWKITPIAEAKTDS